MSEYLFGIDKYQVTQLTMPPKKDSTVGGASGAHASPYNLRGRSDPQSGATSPSPPPSAQESQGGAPSSTNAIPGSPRQTPMSMEEFDRLLPIQSRGQRRPIPDPEEEEGDMEAESSAPQTITESTRSTESAPKSRKRKHRGQKEVLSNSPRRHHTSDEESASETEAKELGGDVEMRDASPPPSTHPLTMSGIARYRAAYQAAQVEKSLTAGDDTSSVPPQPAATHVPEGAGKSVEASGVKSGAITAVSTAETMGSQPAVPPTPHGQPAVEAGAPTVPSLKPVPESTTSLPPRAPRSSTARGMGPAAVLLQPTVQHLRPSTDRMTPPSLSPKASTEKAREAVATSKLTPDQRRLKESINSYGIWNKADTRALMDELLRRGTPLNDEAIEFAEALSEGRAKKKRKVISAQAAAEQLRSSRSSEEVTQSSHTHRPSPRGSLPSPSPEATSALQPTHAIHPPHPQGNSRNSCLPGDYGSNQM